MKDSAIQWTDNTFNPWIGCTKIDELCAHCYAETLDRNRMSKSLGDATKDAPISHWGKGAPRHRTAVSYWKDPIKWNGAVEGCHYSAKRPEREMSAFGWRPHRPRVFCASLADWLDDEVPIEWLADLLELIGKTPNLDWQLLTKRPENWNDRLHAAFQIGFDGDEWLSQWLDGVAPANVWIGTSVGTQKSADTRIDRLLHIPARVRFISVEPLLEHVDLRLGDFQKNGVTQKWRFLNWIICGGESGELARPLHPHWARSVRDQARAASLAFFFKQWGDWQPYDQGTAYLSGFKDTRLIGDGLVKASGWPMYRVGKKLAGRLLDGVEWNEFPEVRA